ncbi:MAG: YfiR family protein [Comamonadaceae bacterium]
MSRTAFLRLLFVLGMSAAATVSLAADEATVKAAYLYNFAKFIQWPDEQRAALRLCIIGDDALGQPLHSLIGKPVRNMQISVRHGVAVHDVPQCDLVFVPADHAQSLERVRQVVNGYPILIVAESSDAMPKGAMVALIQSDGRIVFEVDLAVTRRLGFQVSAKMLQLARKVY